MGKEFTTVAIALLVLYLALKNQQPEEINNKETWTWVDWQGHQRSITVHRDMRQGHGNG